MSIKNNDNKICVVGLGYVGLTLGVTLAYKGLDVFGAEVNSEILDSLKNKKAHFNEDGLNDIVKKVIDEQSFTFGNEINGKNDFDVYFITVGTPLNTKGNPRLDMIKNAASQVASAMNENSLVILRSTVQIGVTREVVKPILDKSGKTYDLAMCPERTLEGNAIEELSKLPQIIGSDSRETSERCASLFNIVTNQTNIISSWEAAEIIKLSDNTLLIFCSDNGGKHKHALQTPFKKGKGWLYEGGIRVPLIISWPKKIKKSFISHQMTSSIDFLPTILKVTNSDLFGKNEYDGIDISSIFSNQSKLINRDELFWHYPHYHNGSGMKPASAIRWKNYKLIEWHEATLLNKDNQTELYDLSVDPGESSNLSSKIPDIAIQMRNKLRDWTNEVNAKMPKVNEAQILAK